MASVSCIYGLGAPEAYRHDRVSGAGQETDRDQVLRTLVEMLYERNEYSFHRGTFRVRGDTIEIFPAYEEERAVRVSFFGDEVEEIAFIDPLRGVALEKAPRVTDLPGQPLRDQREHPGAGHERHPLGAGRAPGPVRGQWQAHRGPAHPASAPCSTWR